MREPCDVFTIVLVRHCSPRVSAVTRRHHTKALSSCLYLTTSFAKRSHSWLHSARSLLVTLPSASPP